VRRWRNILAVWFQRWHKTHPGHAEIQCECPQTTLLSLPDWYCERQVWEQNQPVRVHGLAHGEAAENSLRPESRSLRLPAHQFWLRLQAGGGYGDRASGPMEKPPNGAKSAPVQPRLCEKFVRRKRTLAPNQLILLASPTGFEPVLPP
jgi:hypothetical protein